MYKKKNYTVEEILKKMQRFCAYQERCYQEVIHKINQFRIVEVAQESIINTLIDDDFLNEERFSEEFVRGKFNIKKWGRIRLKRSLKNRGISDYLIDKSLQQIEENYISTFLAISEKKANQIIETDKQKKRKKLADYLLYRGWEYELVFDRIKELIP